MKLLLDTHALLWCLGAPEELSRKAREQITSPDTTVFASVVSAWEMEIKRALGKLDSPDDLASVLRARRFTELPLRLHHVERLRGLPPLHRDPFDRMLVAQAKGDSLTLVTRDEKLAKYGVRVMRA